MKKSSLFLVLSLLLQSGGLVLVNEAFADTHITTNITATTTWSPSGGTYIIDTSVSVSTGVTLTIDPGTVVKFKATTTALTVNGNLKALGTANSKVYFTSYADDNVGGDTNGNGTTSPLIGSWSNIITSGGSGSTTLSQAEVRYGGSDTFFPGQLYNQSRILNLSNTISTSSKTAAVYTSGSTGTTTASNVTLGNSSKGFYFDNSNGTITDSTILNNSTYGIETMLGFRNLSVATTTFTNNPNGAAYINYGGSNSKFTQWGNTANGTGLRGFAVYGSMANSDTWYPDDDMPYIASSTGVTINSGKTLTIKPGTVVKMANTTTGFTVNGILNITGNDSEFTPIDPVYITSLKDDSVGGDTNGDSSGTSPSKGDWLEIKTNSGATTSVSYSIISYGGFDGASSDGIIYNNNGKVIATSSTIASSSKYGIVHGNGTSVISGNVIRDNTTNGMKNNLTSTTTAENNYWGALTGPYHPTQNPSGTGNTVSDYIDFHPFYPVNFYILGLTSNSVDSFNNMQWEWVATSTQVYSDQWEAAIATWNALGSVEIEPNGGGDVLDLTVAEYDAADLPIASYGLNRIEFNKYYMNHYSDTVNQAIATHELGHALGMGHSYWENSLYPYVTKQTTLGPQDINSYNYCWSGWPFNNCS